jgi:predicted regulator of Ras-like GTPase activity (Roadblock/LC7/MglB family)
MAKNKVEELLKLFQAEVPEFVSTDVVNIEEGMSVGGGSIDPNFDSSVASAYYANVTKAMIKAIEAIDPGLEAEDLLITTEGIYILIRLLGDKGYYHGLAITKKGNLGIARVVMKKYKQKIIELL